jgi:hypothetical protein
MPAKSVPLPERFRAKYRKAESGCWIWIAAKDKDGYGGIQVRGEKERAHRVAWNLYRGEIPDGLVVCHRCDNPSCVNPAHLFLGTISDNNADKVAKGRHPRCETHGMAKLSTEEVEAIRAAKGVLQKDLAREYGVSKSLIGAIRQGIAWRDAA